MVVIHSRRAFSNIVTLDYAIFTTFLWATNLYFNRIIFAYDFKELFLAVKKPHQWQIADELNRVLSLIQDISNIISSGFNHGVKIQLTLLQEGTS